MFELKSTKEGLENIQKALNAHAETSKQLAKAFRQQALLYSTTDPLHILLTQATNSTTAEDYSNLEDKVKSVIGLFDEFLDGIRKGYEEKKSEWKDKQTKLQKSKVETPELVQAAVDSKEEFEKFKNQVYGPKLALLLQSNVKIN